MANGATSTVDSVPQITGDFSQLKYIFEHLFNQVHPKKILETGTNVGDSTRLFAHMLLATSGQIVTIDVKPPSDPQWQGWTQRWPYPNIIFITGNSLEVKFGEPLDMAFFDSDHSYGHLLAELKKFGPWVRKEGKILVHDTLHSEFGAGIRQAVSDFCKQMALPQWENYEVQHGLGVIHVDRDLPH